MIPRRLWTEKLAQTIIEKDNYTYEEFGFIPDEYKSDELCELAFTKNYRSFEFFPKENMSEEYCKKMIQRCPYILPCFPIRRKTEEICCLAIEQDRNMIQYVPRAILEKWDNSSSNIWKKTSQGRFG